VVSKLKVSCVGLQERKRGETARMSFESKMEKVREEVRSSAFAQEQGVKDKNSQIEGLRKELRQAELSLKTTTQEFGDYKTKAALALQVCVVSSLSLLNKTFQNIGHQRIRATNLRL